MAPRWVLPRHLNKHIDYRQVPSPAGIAERSLAQPLDMVVSNDGRRLFVAAYGSSKVGIFDTAELESDRFTPSADNHIEVGGGPAGLALDEARNRLYVLSRFDNSVRVVNLATRSTVQTVAMANPEPAVIVNGRRFLYDARFSSSNGEASCGSCHVFGDVDSLAWDLGDPTQVGFTNPGPFTNLPSSGGGQFHPMKGPMSTQSLRGMANHGPMHWRGDRTGGNDAASAQPDSGAFDERAAFSKFSGAFVGLLGRSTEPTRAEMAAFGEFILRVSYPPNPIRALDNSLTPMQQTGRDFYFGPPSDRDSNCNGCHTLNRTDGFFGTNGRSSNDAQFQLFKVPHIRNLYQKVGRFGSSSMRLVNSEDIAPTGDQIRGFGFTEEAGFDTLFRFFKRTIFQFPDDRTIRAVEQFMFASDTELFPVVGQQVTATRANLAVTGARITLLEASAASVADAVPEAIVEATASLTELLARLDAQPDCDLVLLDLRMPGSSGFSSLIQLRGQRPDLPVAIVSGEENPLVIRRAIDFGTCGHIPKSASLAVIGEAVRAMLDGNEWLPEGLADGVEQGAAELALTRQIATLTPQQFKVLMALADGRLNKQIGYDLNITEATVKAHVTPMLRKLGLYRRTQAALLARRLLDASAGSLTPPMDELQSDVADDD